MRRHGAALLLIVTAATLGYGHLWWRGEIQDSKDSDWLPFHLAAVTRFHDACAAGEAPPFWRSDQLSGAPALASPAYLYTYPPFLLFCLLPPERAVGIVFWLHALLAGLGFYAFGGALGLRRRARSVMALAGIFNFKLLLAVYATWLAYVPTFCLIPFLFAAVFELVRDPRPASGLALAAVGGLALLTGWLQMLYYAALFLLPCVLVGGFHRWRGGGRVAVQRLGLWLLLGSALALGLGTTGWLPLAREAHLLSGSDASVAFLLGEHPISVVHLVSFLHPEILGTPLDGSYLELWEDVAYFGIVPLALALFGARLGWRRPFTPQLVACFLVSAALSVENPALRALWSILPGFDLFRLPSRFLFLTGIFGIALAGIGLEEIAARLEAMRGRRALANACIGICALVIVAEGTWYTRRYLDTVPVDPVPSTADFARFFAADASLYRIAPMSRTAINYGWATPLGLQLVTGYDPYNLRHYQSYFDVLRFGRAHEAGRRVWTDLTSLRRFDLLDALNVKYVVGEGPLRLPEDRFERAAEFRDQPAFVFYQGHARVDLHVYRNLRFRPRAFWAFPVIPVADEEQALRALERRGIAEAAIVVDPPAEAFAPGRPPAAPAEGLRVLGAGAGRLDLETERDAPGFVVISEVWHPGWRAQLDGAPLALHQTDLALLGAWIPGGHHRLELRFEPLGWRASLWSTLLAGLAFVAIWVASRLSRRRALRPTASRSS